MEIQPSSGLLLLAMDEEPSLDLELKEIMNMVPSSGDMEEGLQLGDQTMIDDHDHDHDQSSHYRI